MITTDHKEPTMNSLMHRRQMQRLHFRNAHPRAVEFRAQSLILGVCEAPDEIIACPAVEMYAPQDGSQAGKWNVYNVTCGVFATLTGEQFAKIGGMLAI